MIEWLSRLEISILSWINQTATNSVFDGFFPVYTDLHKIKLFIIPIVLVFFYFFYKTYRRNGITYFLILLLSLAISDFTGKQVKDYFNRPRPFTVTELNISQRSPARPSNSFYSNHSSNMFTLATYSSAFFPQTKIIFYSLSALTAYSRMYNGVHYPSDVLVGSLVGIFIGWLFSRLAKKIVEKIALYSKEKLS